ncbi:hypothetical protein Maes01_01837 [Microbulbifer aestuariivivens]|uniref:Uncharacterized protein n=1 Tax=Microbulbifer aestuariivivens TaxID=1908308 RepID=A0ABP9WPY4_9GAMM
MQKFIGILLAAAMATGVAGCSTTASEGAPKSLTVNGQQFNCTQEELESKTLVRCVRDSSGAGRPATALHGLAR